MKKITRLIPCTCTGSTKVPYNVPYETCDIKHGAGSSVNSAICEEISKFCEGFTMVAYEKIF